MNDINYLLKNHKTINKELVHIKDFFTFVGKPQILQSDNGTEYNNGIINNFLTTNNVKHINSSPRYPQTNGVVEIDIKK